MLFSMGPRFVFVSRWRGLPFLRLAFVGRTQTSTQLSVIFAKLGNLLTTKWYTMIVTFAMHNISVIPKVNGRVASFTFLAVKRANFRGLLHVALTMCLFSFCSAMEPGRSDCHLPLNWYYETVYSSVATWMNWHNNWYHAIACQSIPKGREEI